MGVVFDDELGKREREGGRKGGREGERERGRV